MVGRKVGLAIAISALLLAAPTLQPAVGPHAASAVFWIEVSEILPTLFNPQQATVTAGDIVCWVSLVGDHTATAFLGQADYWDSGDINDGATYCHTFNYVGNFTYYSAFPEDAGRTGSVLVQQPTPEFPGALAPVTLVAAVLLALVVERKARG